MEVESIANMTCNLNLVANPLSHSEYVNCLKEKLEFSAIKRLNSTFETQDPLLTWDTVTKVHIKKLIIPEFGNKEPDISSVLS